MELNEPARLLALRKLTRASSKGLYVRRKKKKDSKKEK